MALQINPQPDDITLEDGTTGFVFMIFRPLFQEELDRSSVRENKKFQENGKYYSKPYLRPLTKEEISTKKTEQLVYLPYRVYNKLTSDQLRGLRSLEMVDIPFHVSHGKNILAIPTPTQG